MMRIEDSRRKLVKWNWSKNIEKSWWFLAIMKICLLEISSCTYYVWVEADIVGRVWNWEKIYEKLRYFWVHYFLKLIWFLDYVAMYLVSFYFCPSALERKSKCVRKHVIMFQFYICSLSKSLVFFSRRRFLHYYSGK